MLAFNLGDPAALRGWGDSGGDRHRLRARRDLAWPGTRVPRSLKTFLVALAIIDDLGAVLIIALFYTARDRALALAAAAVLLAVLVALNRFRVQALWPYLLVGAVLWFAC